MALSSPYDLHDEVAIQADRLSLRFGKPPPATSMAGHAVRTFSLSWSQAGDILASSADDGSVHLWSLGDGKRIAQSGFAKHSSLANSVVWSPTEVYRLGTTSTDAGVLMWDHRDGGTAPTIVCGSASGQTDSFWFDFSSDGQKVAVSAPSGRNSSQISIYDLRMCGNDHKPICAPVELALPVTALDWIACSDIIVCGSSFGKLAFLPGTYEAKSDEKYPVSIAYAHTAAILTLESKGDIFVSGASDSMVHIWDAQSLACIASYSHADNSVRSTSISPDAQVIAAAYERDVALHSNNGKIVGIIPSGVWALAWHPTRAIVAHGGEAHSKKESGRFPGTVLITNFDS